MSPSAPELSVVIATNSLAAIRKVLRYYQAQGDPGRLEIVVAALAGAAIRRDAPELEGFPHVLVVPVDDSADPARTEWAGFSAATTDYVVFAESCSYPQPGFVDTMIEACRSRRWAVVGPAMVNANPESATSWAGMAINYGPFMSRDDRGAVALLPGHDSAYQRRALLALGDELPTLIESLTGLQEALRTRGHELFREPAACTESLNVSRPGWYLVDQFGKGRQFASLRRQHWSRTRRLGYAAGSPLIPVIRWVRTYAALRRCRRAGEFWHPSRIAVLFGGLVAGAAGEMVGYLRGGSAVPGFSERNLDRSRYLRPDDTRRDADESTWPA